MPKRLKLRPVSQKEAEMIRRLASSRKESASLVQRARVIQALLDDPALSADEAGRMAGFKTSLSGRYWVKRFNANGIGGLRDIHRPGRPVVYGQRIRNALITLASQNPGALGYPFELWTLERLQRAMQEREGIHLSDSTIWEWLSAGEGAESAVVHYSKRRTLDFLKKSNEYEFRENPS
jgi:transposase